MNRHNGLFGFYESLKFVILPNTYLVSWYGNDGIYIWRRRQNGDDSLHIYEDENDYIWWEFNHHGKVEKIYLFTDYGQLTDATWIGWAIEHTFDEYHQYDTLRESDGEE